MSYKIGSKRQQTMLERVGKAAELIDNKAFLPFYRGVQILLEKQDKADEWGKMIEVALTKDCPSHYFAKLCAMVKAGTYKFVTAVKEVANEASLWVHDKLVKFKFGKYHKYWVHKAQEFINVNGQAGFQELLEYADRKGVSQKYMAAALKNCKPPQKFYAENVLGAAR